HGMSDKPDTTYSRDEYVNDCIAVIEQLHLAPVILIGQSIGGQHAFLVAARRPDLVRALICVEATPDASPSARQMVSKWLDSWPLPFPTLADARTFFGGDTLYAQTWIEVLEERPDGYWPQFHKEHMLRSAAEQGIRDYWHEWDQVRCPTLLVGGANSFVPQQQIQAMAQRLPHAHYTRIANAGHDLHLEQPQAWRETVESFLSSLAPRKTT
ncbi:MAG: alpha/beta hydrolase, partial [Ktedonobacteraceae bacterium]|nr:alpha/beta hydrolase [Ktedonobacteraceae bacterium]